MNRSLQKDKPEILDLSSTYLASHISLYYSFIYLLCIASPTQIEFDFETLDDSPSHLPIHHRTETTPSRLERSSVSFCTDLKMDLKMKNTEFEMPVYRSIKPTPNEGSNNTTVWLPNLVWKLKVTMKMSSKVMRLMICVADGIERMYRTRSVLVVRARK
ncbi:hypothetical protein L2E82_27426 [Cichorium intybus]|uniref:Uncharacterized protein n=1 Tax=Cichorium intybus TaxID=13427 RepID=A0ACB9CSZ8_CICIN|nr:hypothetical protein L2E82_27426 [Cichorium intybus]